MIGADIIQRSKVNYGHQWAVETVRLATKCRANATASGIPMQEFRDVADGDLILRLIQALDAAARLDEDAPIAPEIRTLIETETLVDS